MSQKQVSLDCLDILVDSLNEECLKTVESKLVRKRESLNKECLKTVESKLIRKSTNRKTSDNLEPGKIY